MGVEPTKTALRPFLDLKSGRPTGDASLPQCVAAGPALSCAWTAEYIDSRIVQSIAVLNEVTLSTCFDSASNQRIVSSLECKAGEVSDEARFVFKATQVEDQRLILDAADHRNTQPPQCSGERR